MFISCEFCNTKSQSLKNWELHLASKGHQATAPAHIVTWAIDTVTKVDDSGGTVPTADPVFYLLRTGDRSHGNGLPILEPLATIQRFSRYGHVHNFYVNAKQSSAIVQLELSHGLTELYVAKDWGMLGVTAKEVKPSQFTPETLVEFGIINAEDNATSASPIAVAKESSAPLQPPTPSSHASSTAVNLKVNSSVKTLRTKKHTKVLLPPDLASVLSKVQNFDEQLQIYFENVTLCDFEIEEREGVLLRLERELRKTFPNVVVYPFGSFLSGLGDGESDLDVTVTGIVGKEKTEKNAQNSKSGEYLELLLRKTKNSEGGSMYSNVVQHCPSRDFAAIRFVDVKASVSCHLTFNNLLAVRNSELIVILLELNPKIYGLILLVRQWAKFYDLSSSTKLNNYAIALLVVVFLTRKKFIPSISQLQVMGEAEVIDGWNAGFCRDADAVLKMMSDSTKFERFENFTIIELAVQFFEMFAAEDFEAHVTCSLTAESFPAASFRSRAFPGLPEAYNRLRARSIPGGSELFPLRGFNLQDPFDLQSNVGKSVPSVIRMKIMFLLKKTALHFSVLKNNKKLTVHQLFPNFDIPVFHDHLSCSRHFSKVSIQKEGALDRIAQKVGPLPFFSKFEALKKQLEVECMSLEFGITVEFANTFHAAHDENGDRQKVMFGTWCDFARIFVSRVWNAFCLDRCLIGQLDEFEATNQSQDPMFCQMYTVRGQNFPHRLAFNIRGSIERQGLAENPLEAERRVSVAYRRKGGAQCFTFSCLVILEILPGEGPRFACILGNWSGAPTVKEQMEYIATSLRKRFQAHQLYLLQKWIQNGRQISRL